DSEILNFALTLEHLESAFYARGLKKYDQAAFTKAGFSTTTRQSIQKVYNDEASHVNFLTSALQAAGATPVQPCNYTFPDEDVKTFMIVSQILEGVGVSAYLGAASSIQNPNYLTAAGAILTVEARHNAYVRFVNGESPFPTPMDTPVQPRAIYSIASQFFTSCPNGSAPGFQSFPELNVTGKPVIGGNITLTSNSTGATFCAFLSGLNSTFTPYLNNTCQIPTDGKVSGGQVYIFLTNAQNITDYFVVAGPNVIELDIAGSVQPFGGVNQVSFFFIK
ncbi:ferritin-like domain-containing protein, partial [Phakopsora pachyrhizi]